MTSPSTITSGAFIAIIRRTAEQLGAPLPSGVDDGLTEARALRAKTEQIEGGAEAVNAKVIALLRQDADWRTDPELQALIMERVIAANGIRLAGAEAAEQITRDTLAQHADAILSTWQSAIAPDIAALTTAAEQINVEDLAAADVPTLSRRGLVTVWAEARTAVERLQTALQGWSMLASAAGLPVNKNHRTLILAEDPDPALVSKDVDPWTLARSGAHLSLATLSDYQKRSHALRTRIAAQREEQAPPTTARLTRSRSAGGT